MNIKSIKYELQTILSGKSGNSYDALIQTIAHYLRTGQRTGPMAEEKHQNKAEEREKLIAFATENKLFYHDIEENKYISEGAEQKVYIKNEQYVLKLNDAIYYARAASAPGKIIFSISCFIIISSLILPINY